MNEWNAIDLHLHTVEGITRDGKKDDVYFSFPLFASALKANELKLIAITNHNLIDLANLVLSKYIANKIGVNVLTGVEFDTVIGDKTPIHLAAIFDSLNFDKDYALAKAIKDKSKEKKRKGPVIYDFAEIQDIIKGRNALLIPHGEKDRGILSDAGPERIKEALVKIKEGFIRVFDQFSDWKMSRIKKHLDYLKQEDVDCFNAVLFSDNRDWRKYNERCRHFYMCGEPTFKGLLHATTNPKKRFSPKTEILTNSNYISRVKIESYDQRLFKSCTINLSPQYNCIIGKSGSGKSLLMYLIKNSLSKEDQRGFYKKYCDSVKVTFYNENDEILNHDNINITEGVNFYDKIIKALDSHNGNNYLSVIKLLDPSFSSFKVFNTYKEEYRQSILGYLDLRKSHDESVNVVKSSLIQLRSDVDNKRSLRDVMSFSLTAAENTYKKRFSEEDLTNFLADSPLDGLNKIANYYKGKYTDAFNASLSSVKELLELIKLDMELGIKEYKAFVMKNNIINNGVAKINGMKSAQATSKHAIEQRIPVTIKNISDSLLGSYIAQKKIDGYDLRFDQKALLTEILINRDENIRVVERLDKKHVSEVDIRDNELFETYGFKGMLINEKFDLFNSVEAKRFFDKYISFNVITKEKCQIKSTFVPQLELFFGDDNVKELNPGSIAKKYIEVYFKDVLNNAYNLIMFDQIENDVDKQFIADVIVKLLEDTKGKTQLIVVTHDPIVAVNADPNRYIKATRDNDQIGYRDFVIESSENDEIETVSQTVDGSRAIIKNRYMIYGDKGESYDY